MTGGGSRLTGFVEQLQQQLRVPVVVGSALGRIDCTRLGLPPEEIGRLDPAMAVVVGLALPSAKDVKQLDLLPPEFLAQRARKRVERNVILVAVVIVIAMLGLTAWRIYKIHSAENTVGSLQAQVATLNAEIPKYDKVQQQQAELTTYTNEVVPIVQNEINWPAVLDQLRLHTPPPGAVTTFTGTTAAPTLTAAGKVAPPTDSTPIADLSLGISSTSGYSYFNTWINAIEASKSLQIVTLGALSGPKPATFPAAVAATAVIKSSRIQDYKLP